MVAGEATDAGGIKMARQEWMYAIPGGIGDLVYNYDKMKDYNEKHKDYTRNTGRTYAYATDGFNAKKYRAMGSVINGALSVGSKFVSAGRKLPGRDGSGTTKTTTRDVTTLGNF